MGYKDLTIWQKSIHFAVDVIKLTNGFPKDEIYGLTSQIKRAVVSIPSNIAEGNERNSKKEFSHFLHVALGSAAELSTQLSIAKELQYIDQSTFTEIESRLLEIQKMIHGLIKTVNGRGQRADGSRQNTDGRRQRTEFRLKTVEDREQTEEYRR